MKTNIKITFFVIAGFFVEAISYAGKIQTCKVDGSFCLAQVENSVVGDQVKILDEKAAQVATGRVEKKTSTIALIRIQSKTKIPKRGYPVIEIARMDKRLPKTQFANSISTSFSNAD